MSPKEISITRTMTGSLTITVEAVFNPQTNRVVVVGGKVFNKLQEQGVKFGRRTKKVLRLENMPSDFRSLTDKQQRAFANKTWKVISYETHELEHGPALKKTTMRSQHSTGARDRGRDRRDRGVGEIRKRKGEGKGKGNEEKTKQDQKRKGVLSTTK